LPQGVLSSLADEGFRLFFLLGALHAGLWPALWVLGFGLQMPLADTVPAGLWHAHELLVGAFGAALIGFLTTAAAEWTDTEPPRGRPLWVLAGLWGAGRIVGLFGWEGMGAVAALADLTWMAALLLWLLSLSWRRWTDRLLAFAFWLALLLGSTAAARYGFLIGDIPLASQGMGLVGLAFLGLLGMALARITVPVTNLVLDPTERTSPFRPHPGRLHLAPGLVFVAMLGEAASIGPAVSGFLLIAAGAAFMDRVAEAFIGRGAFRAEILMLAGSSALAGAGLMMTGAARLGAPWSEVTAWHVALMGGLGLSVYGVFCIAGRLHAGLTLGLPFDVRLGAALLVGAVALRVAPDFGVYLPGPIYGAGAFAWAAAFLVWARAYWPVLTVVQTAARAPTAPTAADEAWSAAAE
jgi:uncharacterized protein involved in response to NO